MAAQARVGLILAACFGASIVAVTRPRWSPALPGRCGPWSLYATCNQLGVHRPSEAIFALFPLGAQRVSFADIQAAAAKLGLRAEGRQMTLGELHCARPLGIIHVDDDHFVALIGYESGGVRVADPGPTGEPQRERWRDAELTGRWDGRILVIARRHAWLGPVAP